MNIAAFQDEDQVHRRLDWSLWRRMLRFARPYRREFGLLTLVALVVAMCDVLLPIITGRIINDVTVAAQRGEQMELGGHAIHFAILITTLTGCIWAFILLAGRIATGVSFDIRAASFQRLQTLDFAYFDHRPIGWLMARLTSDCSNLARIMGWALLDIVWGLCVLCGMTIAMLLLNWKLALTVLLIVPPLAIASRWFQMRLLVSSRAVRKANSHVTAGFNENITGVRTTKSLAREPRSLAEFQQLSTTMYDQSIRNALYGAAFLPVVLTICSAGIGLALWYGGVLYLRDSITLGTLVVFISYASLCSNPIQEMARNLTMILGAQASAERIQSLLDTEPTIRDSDAVKAAITAHASQPTSDALAEDGLPAGIGTVEFRNVSFAYGDGPPVLDDFNLTVTHGQTIALVGATGGGKSTIVSLLCRFYEPTSGRILFDGIDYRQRSLHWLQQSLGIVLQSPHLFSGTLRENIRYGRLDATDAQVQDAARLTGADAFITTLTDGYDTKVGEGGSALSTGQKQLVALARAVLADPRIFVMDEATASVDTETEQLVQQAIERVLRDRMAFVIAHRLSTIRHADRILVIDGGRIVEQGDHATLLRRRGRYHELYTRQFAEDTGRGVKV